MDDAKIIQLFWDRSQDALTEVQSKYGQYCFSIANNVLSDSLDSEECVNDCLLKAWNSIPPARPDSLKAYLGKIVRNLALDRLTYRNAEKRGGGQVPLVLDELSECVSGNGQPGDAVEASETAAAINRFLEGLDPVKRKVFVRRYWYLDPVADIAKRYGLSTASVKTMLFRLRGELAAYLKKEGIEI